MTLVAVQPLVRLPMRSIVNSPSPKAVLNVPDPVYSENRPVASGTIHGAKVGTRLGAVTDPISVRMSPFGAASCRVAVCVLVCSRTCPISRYEPSKSSRPSPGRTVTPAKSTSKAQHPNPSMDVIVPTSVSLRDRAVAADAECAEAIAIAATTAASSERAFVPVLRLLGVRKEAVEVLGRLGAVDKRTVERVLAYVLHESHG